ncbi:hypothetical protein SK128_005944, partial [Halocaridina rubra]
MPDASDSIDTNDSSRRKQAGTVGARVALWTRRLEEERTRVQSLYGSQGSQRRSRSARFKTQPVTMEEVAHAHAINLQQA